MLRGGAFNNQPENVRSAYRNNNQPDKDDEWFGYDILVSGKQIVLKVTGQATVDYTEPENPERPKGRERRLLSHGQIVLQAHDPNSTVFYRNVKIMVLPE